MMSGLLKAVIVILAFLSLLVLILPETVSIFESQPMSFP